MRGNVGDSKGTGRNFLSRLGDGGADFGVQMGGGGGEFDFFSSESCDRFCSDQMPVYWNNKMSLKWIFEELKLDKFILKFDIFGKTFKNPNDIEAMKFSCN